MEFNDDFTKLGRNYQVFVNEAALENIQNAESINYSIPCNPYRRNGMHYLIDGQSRSMLWRNVFQHALAVMDEICLRMKDQVYGRHCLHYAATRLLYSYDNPLKNSLHIHCIVEIASRTYQGYTSPDTVYNKTGRQYLFEAQHSKSLNVGNVIDSMYNTIVRKIQHSWCCYKRNTKFKLVYQDLMYLPPTSIFPGGQEYHKLKVAFETCQNNIRQRDNEAASQR